VHTPHAAGLDGITADLARPNMARFWPYYAAQQGAAAAHRMDAARAMLRVPGAVGPFPSVERAHPAPGSRPAIGHPTEVHLHSHRVCAEDIAAILSSREG